MSSSLILFIYDDIFIALLDFEKPAALEELLDSFTQLMKIYIFKKPMERFRTALYERFLEISEKEIDEMSQSVRFLESDGGEEAISPDELENTFSALVGVPFKFIKAGFVPLLWMNTGIYAILLIVYLLPLLIIKLRRNKKSYGAFFKFLDQNKWRYPLNFLISSSPFLFLGLFLSLKIPSIIFWPSFIDLGIAILLLLLAVYLIYRFFKYIIIYKLEEERG